MVTLHVGVLGPLTVLDGDGEIRVAAAKQRRLLGLLALRANEVVAREEIIDLLWPENPPRSCADLVTGYVSRLRRAGLRIDLVGEGYQLTAYTDLQSFESLARRGELVRALDCWRGPVLAELRDHPIAVAVTQRRLDIAIEFAGQAIWSGCGGVAVRYLQPLAAAEPLHESLHARLMLALAGDGRQAAALDLFMAIRRRLADELGVEPSAELQAAHQRVLRPESTELIATLANADDAITAARAAFTVSYRALDADTAALYQTLAVVPGPDISADLVSALAKRPYSLHRLVTAHLIRPTADGRYTFHGLLRIFAGELIAEAPPQLYEWCLVNLCAAADALYPDSFPDPVPRPRAPSSFADAHTALSWLDTERTMLVGVVGKAPDSTAWQLAALLHGYFAIHPHIQDWENIAAKALQAADGHVEGQILASQSMSDVRARQGRQADAVRHGVRALELSRSTGWLTGEIRALVHLVFVRAGRGELEQATEHAAALSTLSPKAGSFLLGHIAFHRGDLEEAYERFATATHVSSPTAMLLRLVALAEIQRELGNLDWAGKYLAEARTLAEQPVPRWVRTFLLRALAELHSERAEHDAALEYVHSAITLAAALGDPSFECDTLNTLGSVCHRRGDHREAIKYYFRALDLAQRSGLVYTQASIHLGLAAAHLSLQDHREAVAQATQARDTAGSAGYRLLLERSEKLIKAAGQGLCRDPRPPRARLQPRNDRDPGSSST
jgi:DNA-binding SARP family transcriptional activator